MTVKRADESILDNKIILCNNCIKRDVCKHTDEFRKLSIDTMLVEKSYENRLFKITTACKAYKMSYSMYRSE